MNEDYRHILVSFEAIQCIHRFHAWVGIQDVFTLLLVGHVTPVKTCMLAMFFAILSEQ